MQYEPPRVVRRERIEALAFITSNADGIRSDVNSKEHIVAVVW